MGEHDDLADIFAEADEFFDNADAGILPADAAPIGFVLTEARARLARQLLGRAEPVAMRSEAPKI